jgi:hypothetical protein
MELSKKHIIYTLGIPVSNVTYINEELRLTILQEQLLYETFLDTIKDFAKDKLDKAVNTITDWKDAAAVFAKILTSPELLKDFLRPLSRLVNTHLQTLYKVLEKIKLSSVVEKIKKLVAKVSNLDGWKQLLILITLGGLALYAATKLPLNGIEAYIAKVIGNNLIDTIVSKLVDWKSYIGYIGPIVGGVTIIYTLLKPLLTSFSAALKSDNRFATKLIKEEEKMRNRFQKLAGINEIDPAPTPVTPTKKQDSSIVTISKDLDDQGSNFKNIRNKEKMVQLLDAVVNKLNPEFKESPAFKQAVIAFYNKYK